MRAVPERVYADTSVFGGVLDPEFQTASLRFFQLVRAGRLRLVTSPAVEDELEGAPADVRALFAEMLALAEVAELGEAALELQEAYLRHGVVGESHTEDALHVALATVSGCSVIVSWSFKHIVSFRRVRLYNAVNLMMNYGAIAIHSPPEVIEDEEAL